MPSITLQIRGVGNIGNFKNRKRAWQNRLITDPVAQKKMRALQNAILSACTSASVIGSGETSTGAPQPFSTASLPPDDCWMVIRPLHLDAELVPRGQEGVDITIDRIQ